MAPSFPVAAGDTEAVPEATIGPRRAPVEAGGAGPSALLETLLRGRGVPAHQVPEVLVATVVPPVAEGGVTFQAVGPVAPVGQVARLLAATARLGRRPRRTRIPTPVAAVEVQAFPGSTQGGACPVRASPSPAREEVGGLPVVLLPETGVGEAGAAGAEEAATDTVHAAP